MPTSGSSIDTIVRRLHSTQVLHPGHCDTVPIQILALNLETCDPITVEYVTTRNNAWEQIVRVLDRERAAVMSRAAAEP